MKSCSQMRIRLALYLISVIFMLVNLGCEMNVKRVVYESMQSVKEQQCFDDPSRKSPECIKREPYDVYERRRQQSAQ